MISKQAFLGDFKEHRITATPRGVCVFPRAVKPGEEVVAIVDVPYEAGLGVTWLSKFPSVHMAKTWEDGLPTRLVKSPFDWDTYKAQILDDGRVLIAFTMPDVHLTVWQEVKWDLWRVNHTKGNDWGFGGRDEHHVTIQLQVAADLGD